MKYQIPEIEIVRFDFTNRVLTLQPSDNNAGAEDHIPSNPVATPPEFDPFA